MKTKLTNNLKLGKTYLFMGYNWTVCELVNDGRTAVLQSHGVTSGAWPGFKMAEFGNGDYYADSIDGQDISAYDHKLKELYNAIKDVEDKSATYGKGLYLVSKEKVGFTKCGKQGSGYYWKALKEAAMNYQSFGAASNGAWLGTVSGSGNPLCVDSNGGVYNGNLRSSGFVVAPAFNLDLSKVEVAGDEIVIKESSTLLCVMKSKTGLQMTPEMPNTGLANMYLERDLTRQKPGLSKVCLLQTMNRVP